MQTFKKGDVVKLYVPHEVPVTVRVDGVTEYPDRWRVSFYPAQLSYASMWDWCWIYKPGHEPSAHTVKAETITEAQ